MDAERRLHALEDEIALLRRQFNALGEERGLSFENSDFFNYHPNALPLFQYIWRELAALRKEQAEDE